MTKHIFLLFSINWFRELINCFSRSSESEDRKLVLQRVKSLLSAEKELLKILPKNLNFLPAPVLPLVDVSSW